MPSPDDRGDAALLDRLPSIAGPGAADRAAATEASALAAALEGVALPPPQLPGWQALCAGEYADAVRRLQDALAGARSALGAAAGFGR